MKYIYILLLWLPVAHHLTAQVGLRGKIGTHPDDMGGASLHRPNVMESAVSLTKITVADTNRPWELTVDNRPPMTDANGWPQEDFQILFLDKRPYNAWANNGAGPCDDPDMFVVPLSGTYKLSFTGQAKLRPWFDHPGARITNLGFDPDANRTTCDLVWPDSVGPNGPYAFMLLNFYATRLTPTATMGSGVSDIRLIRPGYPVETTQPFRTEYLNALAPFAALRYMTVTNTNSFGPNSYLNPQPELPNGNRTEWSDRQQPNVLPFSKATPWEQVIDLANMTGADAWINIPHAATDDYVRQLAQLLKARLQPEIKVYLEYSNELWHEGFTQGVYFREFTDHAPEAADIREGATVGDTYFSSIARPRQAARRLLQCAEIFKQELGDGRVRTVFAWAKGFAYGRERYLDVLKWIKTNYGPPKDYLFGIASATYFGDALPNGQRIGGSPQEVVAFIQAQSDSLVGPLTELSEYALLYDLKHVQYEGGPDNGGGSLENLANRITANRTPEMGATIHRHYARNWFNKTVNPFAEVNDLANYFVLIGSSSRHGCWGALEDLSKSAPKYDALLALTGGDAPRPLCELEASTEMETNKTYNLAAQATLTAGAIARVEFFANATRIGTTDTPPYSISYTPADTGWIALSAKAVDDRGFYTFSATNMSHVKEGQTGRGRSTFSTVTVFPNPNDGTFVLKCEAPSCYEVCDLLGRIHFADKAPVGSTTFQLPSLPHGVYLIKVNETQVQRLLIAR